MRLRTEKSPSLGNTRFSGMSHAANDAPVQLHATHGAKRSSTARSFGFWTLYMKNGVGGGIYNGLAVLPHRSSLL